jgi:SynChlorMet cassette radical SAM/SPASM protein ScmF
MNQKISYPLRQLYFYLTEGCNLRCRHCLIEPKFQTEDRKFPVLEFDLFTKIIDQAIPLGMHTAKLTGGEPFLHPDIEKIIDYIVVKDIRLIIETNGVLCTPELARKITSAKDSFVSVSLDGADPETNEWVRGVKGCFDEALQGIKNLVEAGIRPQIILTIMQKNKDQIKGIVKLAESLKAHSVKFNLLQPSARGEKMHQSGEAVPVEDLIEIGKWVEDTLSKETDLRLVYSHPPAFRSLGKMLGSEGDGCGVCGIFGILGVLAGGSYALCGIGETVPELVFGHAARDDLKDVWEKNDILNDVREGIPSRLKGICQECVMKGVCLGNCIAQNYYRSRDLWAAFWYCEEAERLGLFPQARKG